MLATGPNRFALWGIRRPWTLAAYAIYCRTEMMPQTTPRPEPGLTFRFGTVLRHIFVLWEIVQRRVNQVLHSRRSHGVDASLVLVEICLAGERKITLGVV
jgi:hypothetical protein